MAQVKKEELREAILASAFDLFCRKGYAATTIAEIARSANMTPANLYVYFPSKLVLLRALYVPWMKRQLDGLAVEVRKFRSPRTRLKRILLGTWNDFTSTNNCFAVAIIDALSTAPLTVKKPTDFLAESEAFLTDLILECLPPARREIMRGNYLSHVIWMAFDGFAVNRRLGDTRDMNALTDVFVDLLLGEMPASLEDEDAGTLDGEAEAAAPQPLTP